jgi:hypothetical protein
MAAVRLPIYTWAYLAVVYGGSNLTFVETVSRSPSPLSEKSIPHHRTSTDGDSEFGEYFRELIDEVRIYTRLEQRVKRYGNPNHLPRSSNISDGDPK